MAGSSCNGAVPFFIITLSCKYKSGNSGSRQFQAKRTQIPIILPATEIVQVDFTQVLQQVCDELGFSRVAKAETNLRGPFLTQMQRKPRSVRHPSTQRSHDGRLRFSVLSAERWSPDDSSAETQREFRGVKPLHFYILYLYRCCTPPSSFISLHKVQLNCHHLGGSFRTLALQDPLRMAAVSSGLALIKSASRLFHVNMSRLFLWTGVPRATY